VWLRISKQKKHFHAGKNVICTGKKKDKRKIYIKVNTSTKYQNSQYFAPDK